MRLPSVNTLSQITSYPREMRRVLECRDADELLALLRKDKPFGRRSKFKGFQRSGPSFCSCGSHQISRNQFHSLKMDMLDELAETCGVEYIQEGKGRKSPAIEYLNAGDTYASTLLYVDGVYRVGCWGDIVERGDYD